MPGIIRIMDVQAFYFVGMKGKMMVFNGLSVFFKNGGGGGVLDQVDIQHFDYTTFVRMSQMNMVKIYFVRSGKIVFLWVPYPSSLCRQLWVNIGEGENMEFKLYWSSKFF